jgi:hypothetical protein
MPTGYIYTIERAAKMLNVSRCLDELAITMESCASTDFGIETAAKQLNDPPCALISKA